MATDDETIAALQVQVSNLQRQLADALALPPSQSLQAHLEELKKARRSGARDIWFADRRVTYRSDAELMAQIAALENEIAAAAGNPKPRTIMVRAEKGFI